MNEVVERTEILLPGPARALGALLDVPVPDLEGGGGLPPLWHWIYLLDRPAQADLGPDGHPVRGTVPAPPGPGRRRMWAGGRVRVRGALRCGEAATRRTRVLSVQEKQGRSGPLTIVVVGHQVLQDGRVVVDEEQDIVYREAVAAAERPAEPTGGGASDPTAAAGATAAVADGEWAVGISPTLLFRFSALTYNGHRIHYDRDYARDVEGYPGLLVHGPLQALAMAEAARARGCEGDQLFEYRLRSPLFDHQGMVVTAVRDGEAMTTGVRDAHGRQTATGSLRSLDRP
ncbi:FAS1-like dehydratase domain-containing protein [Streptomyces sp. NPDC004726]